MNSKVNSPLGGAFGPIAKTIRQTIDRDSPPVRTYLQLSEEYGRSGSTIRTFVEITYSPARPGKPLWLEFWVEVEDDEGTTKIHDDITFTMADVRQIVEFMREHMPSVFEPEDTDYCEVCGDDPIVDKPCVRCGR